MRTIHLYGSLAKEFGASFRMDVRSLAEACLAIGSQIPGFRKAIEEGRFRVTCGRARGDGFKLDKSLITFGLPAGDLHIVPVVKGGKSGTGANVGKIIVGTLIAAVAWSIPGGQFAVGIGAAMALSGAASLLAPKVKAAPNRRSYMGDAGNTSDQGGPVPLIIGRCMVGSVTISAGVSTNYSSGLPTTGGTAPIIV
ncbi:tail assembly protein [bacterium BS0013]